LTLIYRNYYAELINETDTEFYILKFIKSSKKCYFDWRWFDFAESENNQIYFYIWIKKCNYCCKIKYFL